MSNSDTVAEVQTSDAWAAVASLALGTFALVTSELLPIGLLPKIAADLHVAPGIAGLSVTGPGLMAALAAPILVGGFGGLDRRILLLLLAATLVISNTLVALAPSVMVLLLGRIILGIGVGGFWAVGAAAAGRLAPSASGRATALVFAGISGGTVIGLPLAAFLGGLFGWRFAFIGAAILSGLSLLAQGILIPKLPASPAPNLRALPAFVRQRQVVVALSAVALVIIGQFIAYTYIATYLGNAGAGQGMLSGVLLAYGAAGLLGNTLSGEFAQRSPHRLLGLIGLLLGVLLLLAPLAAGWITLAVAVVVVWGFAFGGVPVTLQIYMFKAAPGSPDAAGAVFVSTFQVALAAGAWFGGVVFDYAGLNPVLWVGGAVVLAMALVVGLFASL